MLFDYNAVCESQNIKGPRGRTTRVGKSDRPKEKLNMKILSFGKVKFDGGFLFQKKGNGYLPGISESLFIQIHSKRKLYNSTFFFSSNISLFLMSECKQREINLPCEVHYSDGYNG